MTPQPQADHPAQPQPATTRRRLRSLFWFLAFAGIFIFLAAWSWRKWPDVLVDYGLQLYAPWQLSTGKVLYRDVMYLAGGPLSQYFHAIIFTLFGVSFTTLIFTNLILLALFIILVYRLFARATDHWTAAMICIVVLFTFSFSQESAEGNYNYIAPYTYETFHGLLLSVAAIGCLWRWISAGKNRWAFLAGLCAGCVFLTKPDLFLALSMTIAAALLIKWTNSSDSKSPRLKPLLLLALGFLLPACMFFIYYTAVWQAKEGLKAVAAAWLPVLTTHATKNAYYEWCLGLDRPDLHLSLMAHHTIYFFLAIVFIAICARQFQKNAVVAFALALMAFYFVYQAYEWMGWHGCGHALAPITFVGFLYVAWKWWRLRRLPEGKEFFFPLLWAVFSLFLLAKMGFFPRLWHYGFYLAMPAAAFVVLLLGWLLPRELRRFAVNPDMFRVLVAAFLIVALIRISGMSNRYYEQKTIAVGSGGDLLFATKSENRPVGEGIRDTVAWIRLNTAPTNTVAVLPEGVMINYLSRRTNSIPYLTFCLPEVQAYGETNMLNSLVQHSPDYVVIVHRETVEYGVKYFGAEPRYGYEVMKWIHANYSPVWLFGHEPLQTNKFGIRILKRNT